MRHRAILPAMLILLLSAAAQGCGDRERTVLGPAPPGAPRALDGWYHDRAVHLVWEPAAGWDGDSFRVYGKRRSDARYFRIAEVTNCAGGVCSYTDVNVVAGVTYRYFVVTVGRSTGTESPESRTLEVHVPSAVPPTAPTAVEAIALDDAAYLRWEPDPATADAVSHYRVHLIDPDGGADFLLGETDSRGFLDERALNGNPYSYRISAVDRHGHVGPKSPSATAIPRPDFHGEWIGAFGEQPDASGFRFRADETVDPVVAGDDPARHFRLEVDQGGWWLVPGPSAGIHVDAFETTALRCGPASDASCVELRTAPTSGYTSDALELIPQLTYVLRVIGDDGALHYGAVRVELLGTDQGGDAMMIFDWAYQLVPESPRLSPAASPEVR